jgi:DNA-directed RNA polymerase subunit H (RpoH/RPB5)
MSINVEYNSKEITQIIIENVLKMLERRKLIKSWDAEFKKLSDIYSNNIFEININDKTKYSIYLINNSTKINSIVQGTPLDEYLSSNINVHKIIIIRDAARKVIKQVSEYKNAEIFFESEMLEDIPAKVFIPEHQLLNEDEKKELLAKFSEVELARILSTDMMSRYYAAKVGDIFRIIRPSFTAGKNIFYRRVVNGSWDILFNI